MNHVFLNETKHLSVDFLVEGDLVLPEAGTTKYTIRDAEGTIIAGLQDVELDVSSTRAVISIPAVNHATRGYRHVVVSFRFQGSYHEIRRSYRVVDFIPIAANADDVRRVMALTIDELPDNEIDVYYGYQLLLDTGFDLSAILKATDNTAAHANKAVALRTALDLATTLPLRALHSEKGDTGSVARFADIDWGRLKQTLAGQLSQSILLATGGTASTPVFMVTAAPTDPITGA